MYNAVYIPSEKIILFLGLSTITIYFIIKRIQQRKNKKLDRLMSFTMSLFAYMFLSSLVHSTWDMEKVPVLVNDDDYDYGRRRPRHQYPLLPIYPFFAIPSLSILQPTIQPSLWLLIYKMSTPKTRTDRNLSIVTVGPVSFIMSVYSNNSNRSDHG